MQTENLKYSLLDKLISVQDTSLLKKVNDLIGNVDINKTIFKTTYEQQRMLVKSEDDIRDGNLITDDELNKEEDKWLNE